MLDKWKGLEQELHIKQKLSYVFQRIVDSKVTIYVILFCAYFHSVLRFPQGSSITLFRLLTPLSLCIIFKRSTKVFYTLIAESVGLIILSLIQYVLSQKVFFPEIKFSFSNMILFWIHLLSIFVFISLILSLRIADKRRFVRNFFVFNGTVIKISIICDAVFLMCGGMPMDFQLFGNINDFGCAMVAGLAIILCGRESGLSKCFWGGCILVLLYANDSKLALLGALLEIAIFGVIKSDNYLVRRKDRWIAAFRNGAEGDRGYKRFMVWVLSHWRVSSVSVCFILLLAVLMSPIKINGYPISEMVRNAISQFYSGEFFEDSNESLLFRVNAITGMLTILKRSYFCGVGAGNTGIILREILPGMEGMFPNHIYVSPHVWWLELFSDIGSILIIPVLILFVYQIKCFFTSSYKDRYSLLQTMVLLSFPIWCMSASGLYTEYYTQSLLIVAIMGITRKISRSLRKEK